MRIATGTYEGAEVLACIEDTAQTQSGDKAILRVRCSISAGHNTFTEEGSLWLEDLLKDGKPSSNLRGLHAIGLSDADILSCNWGAAVGHRLTVVVEMNNRDYPFIKYFNDPDERPGGREAQPLGAAKRAALQRQMRAALASLGSVPAAPAARGTGGEERLPGELRGGGWDDAPPPSEDDFIPGGR